MSLTHLAELHRPRPARPAADPVELEVRRAVAADLADSVQHRVDVAMLNAEYLAAPRVRLLDAERRLVRVVNAPAEASARPPKILKHMWRDPIGGVNHRADGQPRQNTEPVGKFAGHGTPRDLDYVLVRTRAGDELLALLADEVEPTVQMQRFANGNHQLLATFE